MNNYGRNQRNAIGTLGRHGSFTSGTCGAGSSENRESGEVVPTMDSSAAWTDACVRPSVAVHATSPSPGVHRVAHQMVVMG